MKKILKLIIALVIIGTIAFGVYFLFFNRPNLNNIYHNTYSLYYGQKDKDTNKIEAISQNINKMIDFIKSNDELNLNQAKDDFEVYLKLEKFYNIITVEILTYGTNFESAENANKYISIANDKYSVLINKYNKLYSLLKNGFLKIENLYSNTVITRNHINGFYSEFMGFCEDYNTYFYNLCNAYSRTLKQTMFKNNLYKLKVEFYSGLINAYYNAQPIFKQQFEDKLNAYADNLLNKDYTDLYFLNKSIIDQVYSASENFDINLIVMAFVNNNVESLLTSTTDNEERNLLQNYINFVAKEAI